jgi:DNA-binding XRE family transcriptional regulator
MPTTPLSSALKTKQKEGKLSITALAKAIGANVQSVTAVLKGKSVPNATTAPKYTKFLGLSAEEFQAMTKPAAKSAKSLPAKKAKAESARKAKARAKGVTPTKTTATGAKRSKIKAVTLAEAAELAADTLAVATHRATAEQRRIILAVLGD